MSLAQQCLAELASSREFFNRSTRNLTEALSGYAPADGLMTTAQQVAHVAQTVDWFMEGAFRPEGFGMDFDAMMKSVFAVTSLAAARAWYEKAIASASSTLGAKSDAELMTPLPAGPIMGGAPRMAIISALVDHTAHHRGVLTMYARLNGIVPPMPYMDM
ncbi:MAG: DinB family protein [Bryobacteraceae bacterium]